MGSSMKLSIIMPCYNVEDTLQRALDSIYMQDTTIDYEVIIIDDASNDSTNAIVRSEMEKHDCIRLIENEVNCGNAKSFFKGLSVAQGDYFCVLDGDDYYTIDNKLSKQIRFLDSDSEKEYVAVATHFLIDFGNGEIHIPKRVGKNTFNYSDLLLRNHPYLHTATYMYRNIFKDNVPGYFNMDLYRGDTPRTIFHLMYSGKKVFVLDFVGSAYSYTLQGIWSALNEKKHYQYQIDFYNQHKDYLRTEYERQCVDEIISDNEKRLKHVTDTDIHHYPSASIDECLEEVGRLANAFAFRKLGFMLRQLYTSEYLDTLLASIGAVARASNPDIIQKSIDPDVVCILISKLNPRGGGIFAEISEIVEMFADKEVHVIQTLDSSASQEAVQALAAKGRRVHIDTCPLSCSSRFDWLSRLLADLAPSRMFCYCSHNDPYSVAAIGKSDCENICLFSFDHGFILGLHNPNLGTIAAKRPVDYRLLSTRFENKLSYIPAWSHGVDAEARPSGYEPDGNIITASGAARFYKIDGERPYNYIDIIVELLASTNITHYHFGPIPEEARQRLAQAMAAQSIDPSRFVHIEWSANIPLDMQRHKVALFLEPFPTVSYKLTLDVLAAGIPVAAWSSINRMSIADFIPADSLYWKEASDLIERINGLDCETLKVMSANAIAYFKANHSFDVVKPYVVQNKSFIPESPQYFVDDAINDIGDYLRMFDMDNINVMGFLDRKEQAIECSAQMKQSRSLAIGYAIARLLFRRKLQGNENYQAITQLKALSAEEFVNIHGEAMAKSKINAIGESKIFKLGRYLTLPALLFRRD